MCTADLPSFKNSFREEFDLKSELNKVFIKEKADRIFLEITMNSRYDFSKPISLASAGPCTRFNDRGELVDWNSVGYTSVYLITFEKVFIRYNTKVKEILYYNFD